MDLPETILARVRGGGPDAGDWGGVEEEEMEEVGEEMEENEEEMEEEEEVFRKDSLSRNHVGSLDSETRRTYRNRQSEFTLYLFEQMTEPRDRKKKRDTGIATVELTEEIAEEENHLTYYYDLFEPNFLESLHDLNVNNSLTAKAKLEQQHQQQRRISSTTSLRTLSPHNRPMMVTQPSSTSVAFTGNNLH